MAWIVLVTVVWFCLLPFLLVVMSGINRLGDQERRVAASAGRAYASRDRTRQRAA